MSISTESAVEVVVEVEVVVVVVADDAVSMGADSARGGNEAWLATVSGPGGLEDPLLLDPSPLVVAAAEGGARLLALPYKKCTHVSQNMSSSSLLSNPSPLAIIWRLIFFFSAAAATPAAVR